ncbi:uncharacterized protein MONBRDRAFT_11162 [Monosiga brevicollis MX1]|uniref:Uncharacterized protein n=1 Tax=Monosiga brevicollis TaxID=81824 RepID=A9V8D9_MONBE|nr:uncharacterized protein MONBRDRAFT_11162 [Monosiga brevicollis MX1]EDQ86252.1 predicted protein [Monosiga brevicollis MX1]|eukprot:XP_001748922.1 hypothetical protein [Monosiga brevicollis MX1]
MDSFEAALAAAQALLESGHKAPAAAYPAQPEPLLRTRPGASRRETEDASTLAAASPLPAISDQESRIAGLDVARPALDVRLAKQLDLENLPSATRAALVQQLRPLQDLGLLRLPPRQETTDTLSEVSETDKSLPVAWRTTAWAKSPRPVSPIAATTRLNRSVRASRRVAGAHVRLPQLSPVSVGRVGYPVLYQLQNLIVLDILGKASECWLSEPHATSKPSSLITSVAALKATYARERRLNQRRHELQRQHCVPLSVYQWLEDCLSDETMALQQAEKEIELLRIEVSQLQARHKRHHRHFVNLPTVVAEDHSTGEDGTDTRQISRSHSPTTTANSRPQSSGSHATMGSNLPPLSPGTTTTTAAAATSNQINPAHLLRP